MSAGNISPYAMGSGVPLYTSAGATTSGYSPLSTNSPQSLGFTFPSFGDPAFYLSDPYNSSNLNLDLAAINGSGVNVNFNGQQTSTEGLGNFMLGASYFGSGGNPGPTISGYQPGSSLAGLGSAGYNPYESAVPTASYSPYTTASSSYSPYTSAADTSSLYNSYAGASSYASAGYNPYESAVPTASYSPYTTASSNGNNSSSISEVLQAVCFALLLKQA